MTNTVPSPPPPKSTPPGAGHGVGGHLPPEHPHAAPAVGTEPSPIVTEQQHDNAPLQPHAFTPVERGAWIVTGAMVLTVGVIGLALSFQAVSDEFRPDFGASSWAIPIGADIGIFMFSALAILFRLRGNPKRWVRVVPVALTATTIWFNVASSHTWAGRGAHALMPMLWVLAVEAFDSAVRHHLNLLKGNRMDKIRRSRWLLAPVSTFRLWRQMRLSEITSFKAVLDRDVARATVIGRLRLHYGRLWRARAPLAERIALRLDGRDPAGVATVLHRHEDTTQLLSGSAPDTEADSPAGQPSPDTIGQHRRTPLAPPGHEQSSPDTGQLSTRPDTGQLSTRPDTSHRTPQTGQPSPDTRSNRTPVTGQHSPGVRTGAQSGPSGQPERTAATGPDTGTDSTLADRPDTRTDRTPDSPKRRASDTELMGACQTYAVENNLNAEDLTRAQIKDAADQAGFTVSNDRVTKLALFLDQAAVN